MECAAWSYFEGHGRFICTAQYNAQCLKELLEAHKSSGSKKENNISIKGTTNNCILC